jgi:hypothetical protein
MWVVKFRPDGDEKVVKIYAEDVDLMNMPMVYISGIRTKHRRAIIELPKDEAFEELVECDPLILSYVNVIHIGKLKDTAVVSLGVHNGGDRAEART